MASSTSDIAATLQSYATPSRPVQNGIPAYGLTLASGGQFGAETNNGTGGSMTSYALTFTTGIIVGALLAVRFTRR
jgi:hypothetical protein